jgi:small subunit ribosomal protein S16
MSVKIRLSKIGKTNRPYWRIVAVDARKKRDGAHLEDFGTYDGQSGQVVSLNPERVQAWIGKGAECSATVKRIMKQYKGQTPKEAVS